MKKTVKIDPALHQRLAIAARLAGVSIEAFAAEAINFRVGFSERAQRHERQLEKAALKPLKKAKP